MSFLLALLISLFAVLSLLCLLLMAAYLFRTEREAPHILGSEIENETIASYPLVSIIIAARNEEEEILRCISSLASQTYDNYEVLVVDDNSIDKTKEIALRFSQNHSNFSVISSGVKPGGWIGKSWPCQKGFEASKGDLLLFVDADSILEPKAIETAVKYLQNSSIDMFSISPKVNLEGPWSKSTLPLVSAGINLLYPMTKVNDKRSKRAYVFGTFILVRRTVYDAIGGHAKVKERLVEDAAIAQLAKSSGFKLKILVGDGLIKTHWESDFWSVYHGMERVLSDSIRSYGILSLLDAILVFFLGLYPLLLILGFLIFSTASVSLIDLAKLSSTLIVTGLFSSILSVCIALIIYSNELKLVQKTSKLGLDPLLYPLGFFLFMSAIVTSTLKISFSKELSWKDQSYTQAAKH